MNKNLVFCLLLCCGIPARAATYVVDRADDAEVSVCSSAPNDCTLRGAINRANSNAGSDSISFAANVGNIGLTETLPDIVDTAGLNVNGAGGIRTEIKGDGGSYRLINVAQGGNLMLSSVTLTKGNAPEFGGAIYNSGSLSLSDCQLFDNKAESGGGIYNFGGQITAQYSSFWFNNANDVGGAIVNTSGNGNAGTITVSDSSFKGNIAAAGGAIRNSAALTMRRCSLDFNKATASQNDTNFGGGGIFNDGPFTLESSTFYRNGSNSYGGGALNRGAMTVHSCTFSQDGSPNGGAVAYAGNSTTFGNTIFDAAGIGNVVNLPGTIGSFSSEGYNISSDATGPNSSTDRLNTDPKLSEYFLTPPGRAGYVSIQRDSPAADSGFTTISSDVIGQPRPFDIPNIPNAAGSNGADVGAYEIQKAPLIFSSQYYYDVRLGSLVNIQLRASNADGLPLTFRLSPDTPLPFGLSLSTDGRISGMLNATTVEDAYLDVTVEDNAGDLVSANVVLYVIEAGSLVANTTSADDDRDGKTTLREAVNFANSDGVDSAITFDSTVFAAPRKKITLSDAEIELSGDGALSIAAPVAGIEVNAGKKHRIFSVTRDAKVTLKGLTLTGADSGEEGGAIFSLGDLLVDQCTMSDNTATYGAAIFSGTSEDCKLIVRNSTFSNNTVTDVGGAVYNFFGEMEMNSVTIVGNRARANGGGGVASYGDGRTLTRITNSIIAGNSGEGVANDVQVIIGKSNSFESQGYNHIGVGNATDAFVVSGDSTGGNDSGIGPLAENGGPTPTRALLAGSLDVDRGQTDLTVDQRGITRPQNGAADRGAYEAVKITVSVSLTPGAPKTNDPLSATVNTSVPVGGGTATLSYEWQKNGVTIPGETGLSLNLAKFGNGDKGDIITVVVTATGANGAYGTGFHDVTVANSAPIAVSSQGTVAAATEKAFVLNAYDADGDALTYKRVGGPRNGVTADIRVDPTDGKTKLFYQSRPFYGGVDIIRFVAVDNEGKTSNVSTLGIQVLYTPPPPANRAPIAGDTSIDTYVGDSVVKRLLGSDPDGDAITFRIVGNAKYGKSEIKRDKDGLFKLFYTSLNRFYDNDAVTYIVTDSRGKESNLATVKINFINRAPVARGNRIGVAAGAPVSQFLFGTDEDGDALTFRLVNNPRYGTGEIKRDEAGKWRFYYQSLPGYVGPDQITFIAIDPQGKQSPVATIVINVVRTSSTPSALTAGAAPSGGSS